MAVICILLALAWDSFPVVSLVSDFLWLCFRLLFFMNQNIAIFFEMMFEKHFWTNEFNSFMLLWLLINTLLYFDHCILCSLFSMHFLIAFLNVAFSLFFFFNSHVFFVIWDAVHSTVCILPLIRLIFHMHVWFEI